jgi:hypothetical protein
MTERVDKDSLPLNQPRRTPNHPTKSHIVKTKVNGKEKIIRFGEQGASTAGKPKAGESDRMKAKRASFKSRHAANIAKGPASAAYWADKVKWADGGSVRTHYAKGDSVQAQPQNAALGRIAEFLKQTYSPQRTQQMQGTMEFLGVPALARTAERLSYGQPITNINKANVPLLPDDTAEAAMLVAPPLTSLAKRVGTNLVQTAPAVARDVVQSMTAPTRSYIVPPQGNLNLTPMARAEVLKGPELQTPENFLNQLRGKPGMTQEGFDDLVKQYQGLEPNTRMTKAEFEQRIPPSKYNKVDLVSSAESADAHLLQEAEDLVMEDRWNIYEGMLDRLGTRHNRENLRMLDEYHNDRLGFGDLSPELQQSLRRAGMHTPDGRAAIDDLFAEERSNAINNTFQTLREQDHGFMGVEPGGYTYQDFQRLLTDPDETAKGYFEIGVSHPEQRASYKHYPGHENEEGLIGHVRGTFIPANADDEARKLINPVLSSDEVILAKPNSMIIEEIQSDAQKGKAQSGALRQAHGTVFKAAIQHALEGGVDTVYYPTAKTIGGVRLKESSAYAPIYDQQIIKEGLKPLLKIPGVDAKKIGDAYYEINFTPEAKDFILKGEGQSAPGYAEGGKVRAGEGLPDPTLGNLRLYSETVAQEMFPSPRDNAKRDAARHMLASAIAAQKTNPTIADLLGKAYELKEAPFRTAGYWVGLSEPRSDYPTDTHNNALGIQLGTDNRSLRDLIESVQREAERGTPKTQKGRASLQPDEVKSTRYAEGGMVGTPPTTYDPFQVDQIMGSINAPQNYAQGGSVSAYDPSRVDAIVNQFM